MVALGLLCGGSRSHGGCEGLGSAKALRKRGIIAAVETVLVFIALDKLHGVRRGSRVEHRVPSKHC